MTETTKFKGIVREKTLRRLIDRAIVEYQNGKMYYWTEKNLFEVKQRNTKYWEISIVFGNERRGRPTT